MKVRFGFLVAAGALVLACVSIDQITSRRVMVATVLGTPRVPLHLGAPLPDGGTASLDAGVALEEQTVAVAFLGELARESLDDPPEPIAGADFTAGPEGSLVLLKDEGGGRYGATSADTTLRYESGKTYRFVAKLDGEPQALEAEVREVPLKEEIAEFHPSTNVISLAAGTAFTFTRPTPPAGVERPFGFVTVFPVGNDGSRGEPTYTNMPVTFLGLLRMVVNPNSFKQTEVTIPGTAFPAADSNYVILFHAAKMGRATSSNLSAFSAVFAGVADVGAVQTQ